MREGVHPAIALLLSRMDSHPEEFTGPGLTRWARTIDQVQEYARPEDLALFDTTLNNLRMARVHEDIMDELLNGDERRAAREADAKKAYAMVAPSPALTAAQAAQLYNSQYPQHNPYGTQQNSLLGALSPATNTLTGILQKGLGIK